jgi:hypothetical protein
VGPPLLVGAELALLVVHLLVQVLDQLEADHAVVGRAGVIEELVSVLGRSGEDLVDVLGVEDLVDTG